MRGYGRTDKVETAFTFDDLVYDVIKVCKKEIKKCFIFTM